MAKFQKKRGKASPAISTASLPDIIFILLFFFMVVTVMKDSDELVKITLPKATELTKLEDKSLVSVILIGEPIPKYRATLGTAPRVQLNDAFATPDDIIDFIEAERAKRAQNLVPRMSTSLKVDRDVTMGIVSDVKIELRKANALKLLYSTYEDN